MSIILWFDWIPYFTKLVIRMSYYRWRHCASLPCWPCWASGPGRREPGSWRQSRCWTATLWRVETWLFSTTSSTLAQGNNVGKWAVVQLVSLAWFQKRYRLAGWVSLMLYLFLEVRRIFLKPDFPTFATTKSPKSWLNHKACLLLDKLYILILTCHQYYIQSFMRCHWSLANIRPIHLIGRSIWNVAKRLQPKYFHVNTVKQRLSWNQDLIKVLFITPINNQWNHYATVDEWNQYAAID